MKNELILFFLILLFLALPLKANALTVFSEQMQGNQGQDWSPTNFSLVNNSSPATYGVKGIKCLNGSICQYEAPISLQDNIIKFKVESDGNPENLLFSCRDANNYADEFRAFLHDDGTTHLERFSSGNGSGVNGIPNYDFSKGIHQFELDCIGSIFSLKEDGKILATDNYSSNTYGNFNYIRFDLWKGTWTFSNYEFCDSTGCDDVTPTPTPTPEVNLNVPLIKQTSEPWQSQEYDTAHLWSPNSPTIRDWGCALSSATMILQYNGIIKMPDNTNLDPSSLNNWLKSQPDGYFGDGLVNWLAISRLSRLIRLAFNNPSYTADALEWKWSQNNTNTQLSQDLHNNIPDILNEPGHFIVAKGTQGTTFTINDPSANKTLLTDYGNTFAYAGKFVPSHTDLSYILFVGPNNLSFDAKTATGSSIGKSFIQEPLTNDSNPTQMSGSPKKIFYIEQPSTDSYQVNITGSVPEIYNIKAYAYDLQGNVATSNIEGSIDTIHPNVVTIPFDKTQNGNDQIKKQVTIPLLLFDLQTLYNQNLIKKVPYTLFSHVFTNIQKASARNRILEEKILLRIASILLGAERPLGISDQAYLLLSNDISFLLSGE